MKSLLVDLCRPTICANGSTKVSVYRRSGGTRCEHFHKGNLISPLREPGATPDSRSRGRSDARCTHIRAKKSIAYPRCDFYCVSGHANTGSENWCAYRGASGLSARQRLARRLCRNANVTPLTGKTTAGYFKRTAGAGKRRGNRHPVPSRRRSGRALCPRA